MTTSWLKARSDIFLRDLFRDFFTAKLYFDTLAEQYNTTSTLPFKMLDGWVGTEANKGPLWDLKDQSHRLFRKGKQKKTLYEPLLDWTIGSIFHEAMKLKEDCYQVESYKPLLEIEVKTHVKDKELSRIISEYFSLIDKATANLQTGLESISELFDKALIQLQEIIVFHKNNALLLRLLLDNKKTIEKVFGKGAFVPLFEKAFPEGLHSAYLKAAGQCIDNGWTNEAEAYLKKALKYDPHNKKALKLLSSLQTT
ncbi:MAG: hypothetical protein GY868_00835 [Deltaproteobacteria bacterium]|nr:hypothetical protein [Deltaproteobacteria bacterium]